MRRKSTRNMVAGEQGAGRGGLLLSAVCLCASVVLCGCDSSREDGAAERAVETVARGPFQYSVEVAPKEALLGDPIRVNLRFVAPADYIVGLPDESAFGEELRDEVRAGEAADPRPAVQGGLVWERQYTIERYAPGPLEIPALAAKYVQRPSDPDALVEFEHELETPAVTVAIRSALTTQDSVVRPRDITGTLTPAWTRAEKLRQAGLVLGVVGGVLALGLAGWLWWRRPRRGPPPVPAEVWALQALAALERAGWFGDGRVREFYYRVSEIVRGYLERKFAIAAPEMTTEEFLSMLARGEARFAYDAGRLRSFMEACDLVKYAAFRPRAEDAEAALATARAFVSTTAARAAEQKEQESAGREAVDRGAAVASVADLIAREERTPSPCPLPEREGDSASPGPLREREGDSALPGPVREREGGSSRGPLAEREGRSALDSRSGPHSDSPAGGGV